MNPFYSINLHRLRTAPGLAQPSSRLFQLLGRALLACAIGGLGVGFTHAQPSELLLLPAAQVDSQGVFLRQIVSGSTNEAVPEMRLTSAPGIGQVLVLGRGQLQQAVAQAVPALASARWSGADRIRVTRRLRVLRESDLKELLTSSLQQEKVKAGGELDLRLARAWLPVSVPDEPLTLKIIDFPASGLGTAFTLRFELHTAHEMAGAWPVTLQAKVWREVWVARSALRRGQSLADADLMRERRDLLLVREPLAEFATPDASSELADYVAAGNVLLARSIKLRPIIRRGQSVEAIYADGVLNVSIKAEALEEGAPGQTIRVRNSQTRRELRGKVQDEQTILLSL